jgi:hypothetical protein
MAQSRCGKYCRPSLRCKQSYGHIVYVKARVCNQHYYEHQRRKIATRFTLQINQTDLTNKAHFLQNYYWVL